MVRNIGLFHMMSQTYISWRNLGYWDLYLVWLMWLRLAGQLAGQRSWHSHIKDQATITIETHKLITEIKESYIFSHKYTASWANESLF